MPTAGEILPHPSILYREVHEQAVLPMGSGFSSNVYRVGEYVVKISKYSGTPKQAERYAAMLQAEHDFTREHLDAYVPPTRINTTPVNFYKNGTGTRVGIVQRYIEGLSLKEALADDDLDRSGVEDFLEASLDMYRSTGVMPDIAHVEHAFRVSLTPNIIIERDSSWPVLIDTNRGRTQRKPGIGRVWSLAMAVRARRELIRLENRPPEAELRFLSVF